MLTANIFQFFEDMVYTYTHIHTYIHTSSLYIRTNLVMDKCENASLFIFGL